MSAVCPACGVAVVPGYVRCPKCHASLPYGASAARGKRNTASPSGTALDDKGGFPFTALISGAVVAAAIILFFGLRGGNKKIEAAPAPEPIAATPTPAPQPQTPARRTTTPAVQPPSAPTTATPRSPDAVAADLAIRLRAQRLWSTVEVTGGRVDVRSGACVDPQMQPSINAAAGGLRDAGLTKLRCLAQSGAVVFERDL